MVISAGKQSEQTIIIVTSKMVPPTILWGECFFFLQGNGGGASVYVLGEIDSEKRKL